MTGLLEFGLEIEPLLQTSRSVWMRVDVLDCKRDRLARFASSLLLTEADQLKSIVFGMGLPVMSGSTTAHGSDGGSLALAGDAHLLEAWWNVDAPPCQFREQTHASLRERKALRALFGSMDLFFTSWLLCPAACACGIAATLHNPPCADAAPCLFYR